MLCRVMCQRALQYRVPAVRVHIRMKILFFESVYEAQQNPVGHALHVKHTQTNHRHPQTNLKLLTSLLQAHHHQVSWHAHCCD